MGIAAGISAIGGLGSSLMTSSAASNAANTEANATSQATALLGQVGDRTNKQFQPYRQLGQTGVNALTAQLPQLTSQFDPTEASLEATPGYQFDLSQGLKSTQNSAAARGLGVSGAALKGASTYATGLADNTQQTQFNIDQTNKTNAYNKLAGVAGIGESAVNAGGTIGAGIAGAQSNALMAGATGQASAQIAQGTALNPLLQNAGNYYTTAGLGVSKTAQGGSQLTYNPLIKSF